MSEKNRDVMLLVLSLLIFSNDLNVSIIKKAELTPGLARDRAATWRLTVNLDSSTAILTV